MATGHSGRSASLADALPPCNRLFADRGPQPPATFTSQAFSAILGGFETGRTRERMYSFQTNARRACDRSIRTDQVLRYIQSHRGRQLHGPARRDPGVPRAKRRRQDHDHAHPDRLHARHGGRLPGGRPRRVRAAGGGEAPDRLFARERPALPRVHRVRIPAVRGPDQGRTQSRPAGRAGTDHRPLRAGERAPPPHRPAVEGLPPAGGPGPGAGARPRGHRAGRAHHRARPGPDPRGARVDQGSGSRSHHHPLLAHPARGEPGVRPRGHHQQGAHRGRGHTGEPDGLRRRSGVARAARGRGRGGAQRAARSRIPPARRGHPARGWRPVAGDGAAGRPDEHRETPAEAEAAPADSAPESPAPEEAGQ